MENKKINFCPKCGNKLTGDEKFCSACGNALQNEEKSENRAQRVEAVQEPKNAKKKPSGKIKKILLVIGGLLVICVAISLLTNSDDNEQPVESSEAETLEETTLEAEGNEISEDLRTNIDVITTLNNCGIADPKFELTDKQTEFIREHQELFPAVYGNLKELSNIIDPTMDYSHMIKNPRDLVGRFALMDELAVRQIWEESYKDGEGVFDYLTTINMYDESGNNYYVYYVGRSTSLVEDDLARVIAMPIAYSSYEDVDGKNILTLVMVASIVEDSEDSEMTMDYFSPEINETETSEVETESTDDQNLDTSVSAGELNYEALAGQYQGGLYTIEFSVGSDVDSDLIGDVCVYSQGNCEGFHLPVYMCNSAGDWDVSDYDAVYEIRDNGDSTYMMFYEKDGTIYMEYNSPYRNYDVLELVQHYES